MRPDPTFLLTNLGLSWPLIGFYDAPDPAAFAPLVEPKPAARACIFAFHEAWLQGKTLRLTRENYGCGGAGHWMFGLETRSREDFVKFLVDGEGLKANHALMEQWLDHGHPYQPQHAHLFIGPMKEANYEFLRTVTFFVNPDQLSILILGANYHASPKDPAPVISPFGAGCMEMAPLFDDLSVPQAIIGATDMAMRDQLPPDIMAFTVTKPMFERLCTIGEDSFLSKPFLRRLKAARAGAAR
jgi:hypothetical protein